MTVFEWFTFEIMTFSTSYLGTVPLAAQGILVSVTTVLWHIPFSASIAVSTRIGFFVGRNAILQAKKFTPLYSGFVLVIALFNCGIILIGRGMITRMLGTEEDVSIVVIAVFRFAAIYQVFASTSCLVVGIVRGLGKQSTGALLTLVINHAYTLPVSLFLELGLGKFPGFGLSGLWTGLASGQLVLTISLAIFLRLTHWQLAVEKLISREAGRQSI